MVHGFWFGYEVEKSRRADMKSGGADGQRRHLDHHPQTEMAAALIWSDALTGHGGRTLIGHGRRGSRRDGGLLQRLWR